VARGAPGEIDVLTPRAVYEALVDAATGSHPWPAGSPAAAIESPADGSEVGHQVYVSGTFEGLAAGTTVLVVVKAPNGLYYPQSSPVTFAVAAGPQRVLLGGVFVGGGPGVNVGESFDLFLATTTSEEAVDKMVADGLGGGVPAASWPGVTLHPAVTVTRK
jgi:hypothetical protein